MESSTGTASSVLLGFTTTRIRYQKISVVFNQSLSQFILGALVNILGVVSNDGLGNSSSDGVDLSGDTSTLDSDADIEVGELVLSNDQDRLENLQAKSFWLNILNRLSIDLDKTPTLLGKSNGGGGLFPERAKTKNIKLAYQSF